jgi:hypothetical protein
MGLTRMRANGVLSLDIRYYQNEVAPRLLSSRIPKTVQQQSSTDSQLGELLNPER